MEGSKLATSWISMDCLYIGGGVLLQDAWIHVDQDGAIVQIGQGDTPFPASQHVKGLVWGGLVNAHCHLELSHMKGQIPEGTGMAGFVRKLQGVRAQFTEEDASMAASAAVQLMWERGIKGVGDICNGTNSLACKLAHPEMSFHSFVEVFGLDGSKSDEIFQRALGICEAFGERASVTLHAPYSISIALRNLVQGYAHTRGWVQSLHVLESKEERLLFEGLEGPLMDMLRDFKAPFPGHESKSSLTFLAEGQPADCKTLFVHTTEMTSPEAKWVADRFQGHAYIVLCPRANQFIHGTLPPVQMLAKSGIKLCLGTDSLSGNWDLDLWGEMRVLQDTFGIGTGTLLQWAVDNGCEALQFERSEFIPEVGKTFRGFQMVNFDRETGVIPVFPVIMEFRT